MWTSSNALMKWPDDQNGGGQGALIVLDKNLKYLYATCIGTNKSDGQAHFNAMVINQYGIILGGSIKGKGFHSNTPSWSVKESENKRVGFAKVNW